MNNKLELKTINHLLEYSFYIPKYQRGYRWTPKEIEDLLNDISDFKPKQIIDPENKDFDKKTWYCLQPIVIKKVNENNYEVIDGQQRLTTIYLILFYLNQYYTEDFRTKLFELSYETRKGSKDFLLQINQNIESNNIDYFYIKQSYDTIKNWFQSKDSNFNRNDFESNFKYNTRVIWYESNEDDSVALFTRINIGKIPLTNSELIKALFLNSSNFNYTDEKLKLRQLEIASEWDFIEQSLQKDKFWFFLTRSQKKANRIEFIFDLMNTDTDTDDNYSTFRFFNKKFHSKSKDDVEKNWAEIKKRYQRFNEWFDNREYYHKIGYLIAINHINIKDLYNKSSEMSKREFSFLLDSLIKESVYNISIEDIQYFDKHDVRKILLLYNILTMLKSDKDSSYFPFDIFKNDQWDIEHITSIKNNMPEKNRYEWLQDAIIFIDITNKSGKLLKKRADEFTENDVKTDEVFKDLYDEIISHFNEHLKDEDLNDLSNLTLLDSETNRSYKNAVFPLKRKTIIDRDKNGVFIPICTKNVFLKYFSDYPPKISFWSQEDRENYENDLTRILTPYLTE